MTAVKAVGEPADERPVWQHIAAAVAAEDVEAVFGVIGLGNMQLAVHLASEYGVAYHPARHESGAISMADGYARATGRPGVCTVTAGPGLTNALTSLLEAQRSATPLVLLAGQSAVDNPADNQYLEQERLLRSVDIEVEGYSGAAGIPGTIARAFSRARRERRPVVVNLPLDLQHTVVALPPGAQSAQSAETTQAPADESVQALADLLSRAQNPVVLAGRGAVVSDARSVLEELADRVGALLMTSGPAKGFFSGNPFSIGVAGGFSTRRALQHVDQADLVLCFGASLNPWQTRHGKLFPSNARLVHVDTDSDAIDRYLKADLGIVGDVSVVAAAVVKELAGRGVRHTGMRTEARTADLRAFGAADEWTDASREQDLDPRTLTARLDGMLPTARTVASGDGICFGWSILGLSVPDEQAWLMMYGFQSLGHALGAAVGAAVGRPDRLAVATLGDGGLMMALSELDTAVRVGRPLVVIVYNDSAYGAEVFHLTHHFGGLPTELVRFPDVDFAATARALGCQAVTVRKEADLEAVQRWLEAPSGTLLIDAKVTPDVWADWTFS